MYTISFVYVLILGDSWKHLWNPIFKMSVYTPQIISSYQLLPPLSELRLFEPCPPKNQLADFLVRQAAPANRTDARRPPVSIARLAVPSNVVM